MSRPIEALVAKYNPKTAPEMENALKEVIQEIALAGLARAKFFEVAAFYGGTAARIFHGLPRFSEDLDFTLLSKNAEFSLKPFFNAVSEMLESFGVSVEIEELVKNVETPIESAFLKANTKIHFLKIEIAKKFADRIQSNKKLNIKFEVDTMPPLGFETEIKVLPPPITASVRLLTPSCLFAGKMHAILFRDWKNRVKGRDFYDLLWYLGLKTPLSLSYLERKMREGGKWTEGRTLLRDDLIHLLEQRLQTINFISAAKDVEAFIRDPAELADWNLEHFLNAISALRTQP